MKALVCHKFGPIDDLNVEELPSLEPQANEVVVRVAGEKKVFHASGTFALTEKTP